jgi:hypothetical protein
MAATILEIVYQSAIRIGSKIGSATGADGETKETYALTVLKRKHFKVLKNRVKLHYIGKAAQEQTQYLIKGKETRFAIFAITSLQFILLCVPEPVCHTTSGN